MKHCELNPKRHTVSQFCTRQMQDLVERGLAPGEKGSKLSITLFLHLKKLGPECNVLKVTE